MKKIKKITALALASLSAASLVACTPELVTSIDKNRTQIYIQIHNGGYGTTWIDPVVKEFEEDYPEYQIILNPRKYGCAEIEEFINMGTEMCAFLGYQPDFAKGFSMGLFADLSDMLTMKVDGTDKTIGDKLLNKEQWMKAVSVKGQGCYSLPYAESINGFVYDHTAFVQRGLMYYAENTSEVKSALDAQGFTYHEDNGKLIFDGATKYTNYTTGDAILRSGKDGKYGTYDDGQPVTEAEFDAMVKALSGDSSYAFLYSGKVLDYTTDIFTQALSHYEGETNYETFTTYEGSYTFEGDSEATAITHENGYKVYEMEGVEKAFKFYEYLLNEEYAHPQSFFSECTHTDAQSYFLLGAAMTSADNPFSGMLVEGSWWENEARSISAKLAERGYTDYAYGKHDFRYMLLPNMEGQNAEENKSSIVARDTCGFVVNGRMNEEMTRMTKIFLSYTLKDKYLRHFTVSNGAAKPYDYELTSEDIAQMSKFAYNNWTLQRDTENIQIARPWLSVYADAMNFATPKGTTNMYYSIIDNLTRAGINGTMYAALDSMNPMTSSNPAKASAKGMAEFYKGNWPSYYAAYASYMGN